MAIEITPKPKTGREFSINVLFYIVLILFLIMVVGYFVLNFYQKKMENELAVVKKSLEKTTEEKALEEKIFGTATKAGYQQKIKDFATLLSAHRLPVNLFNFIEENIHPEVWISKFNLDAEKNLLELTGEAESFEVLGQQASIFKGQSFIKNINLSRVSLGEGGKISFELQLILDPQIFK